MKRSVLFILVLVFLIPLDTRATYAETPPFLLSSPYIQAPDNIWYGTNNFIFKHWDGNQWQKLQGLPSEIYQFYDHGEATLALSKRNVWIIGTGPSDKQPLRIYHLDGAFWESVPAPVEREEIHAMAALAPSDIWAIGSNSILGYNGGLHMTYVMHWDGNVWQHRPSPYINGSNTTLWAVSAIAKNDVWAAGDTEGTHGGNELHEPLFEHWDGKVWRIVPSPLVKHIPDTAILSITALSKDDVWAVGSKGLVEHWNGMCWKIIVANQLQGPLTAVSAISKDDVWAVGYDQQCDAKGCRTRTFTTHWDGHAWQKIASPSLGYAPRYDNRLVAVRAFATNTVFALGYTPSDSVFLEHWNGKAWTITAQDKLI